MRIIVSGSSAELLSRELGTLLTGRHLDVEMFRLDLSECMRFHGVDPEDPLEEPYLLFFHRDVFIPNREKKVMLILMGQLLYCKRLLKCD